MATTIFGGFEHDGHSVKLELTVIGNNEFTRGEHDVLNGIMSHISSAFMYKLREVLDARHQGMTMRWTPHGEAKYAIVGLQYKLTWKAEFFSPHNQEAFCLDLELSTRRILRRGVEHEFVPAR